MSIEDWIAREAERDRNRVRRLPWIGQPWFVGKYPHHFAHVSDDDPSQIAYTPNAEYGVRDRQVRTRPGKYLGRFFGDVLTEKERLHWTEQWNGLYDSGELHFATDPDEIVSVYLDGPNSCMCHPRGDYGTPVHPTYVYGAGDLAIAYTKRQGDSTVRITARALCWPDQKYMTTPYGDSARLVPMLEKLGYRYGDLNGARLLRIEYAGGFICPYLDCASYVSDDGKFLRIDNGGEHSGKETCGCTVAGQYCPECEEHADPEGFGFVEDQGVSWCEGCREHTWHCDRCGDRYSDSTGPTEVNGCVDYCPRCVYAVATECEGCGEFFTDGFRAVDDSQWCEGCAMDADTCADCGTLTANGLPEKNSDGDEICADCADEPRLPIPAPELRDADQQEGI